MRFLIRQHQDTIHPVRTIILVISAALGWISMACAQTGADSTPHRFSPAALETAVTAAMTSVHANGIAVAVVDGGKVVTARAFGRRNEAGDLLREDTVMVAASLTKPVFAYLVMQLVAAGQIDLDTSIAHYLPQPLPSYPQQRPYPAWGDLAGDERWRAITPRMLLSHRSGLPNLTALEPGGKLRLRFDPGSRFAYSGVGINLLQFVLEQGLGLDIDAELRRHVFQRFDMRHTSLTWQSDSANNQADGYISTGELRPHPQRMRAAAAGSMGTTIEDYARFVAGFMRDDERSDTARKAMTTPQGPITTATQFPTFQVELPDRRRRADLTSGLGLVLFDGPQGPGFFKGGHEDYAGNMWVCILRSARCIVLLSNDVRAERVFPGLVAAILGDTAMPWLWEYGH